MSRPKYRQGYKDTRVSPRRGAVPTHTTRYHRKIDQVLARDEAPPPPESEPDKHRHKYKKVVRENQDGTRVVACACGDCVLVSKP